MVAFINTGNWSHTFGNIRTNPKKLMGLGWLDRFSIASDLVFDDSSRKSEWRFSTQRRLGLRTSRSQSGQNRALRIHQSSKRKPVQPGLLGSPVLPSIWLFIRSPQAFDPCNRRLGSGQPLWGHQSRWRFNSNGNFVKSVADIQSLLPGTRQHIHDRCTLYRNSDHNPILLCSSTKRK